MSRRLPGGLRDERGSALVMALWMLAIFTLTTGAVLTAAVANQQTSGSSSNTKQAFALARTALAYAEGMLYRAAAAHTTPATGAQTLPAQPGGGTGTYWVSVSGDGVTWTMFGSGTVGGVTQTVSAQANVPSPVTVYDTGVWNYLYADSTAPHSCSNSWDTFQGGATVSVPVLTRGDLCITGGAHFTGSQLEVGGKLIVQGGANVGTASTKLQKLNIAGTPSSSACQNGTTAVTPGTSVCDGSHASIYATAVSTTLSITPQMPTVDFAGKYATQAGLAKSGCPAGLFDGDSTLNDSVSSVALAPYSFSVAQSYDCHVGSNEIRWTQTSKSSSAGTLYVNGSFYFDGNLSLGNGQVVTYSGQGSLYFTGTVLVNGGAKLCGIANCTTSWNPDQNGVIVVARCWENSSGELVDTDCVHLTGGAICQLGAYVTTNYHIDGGAVNMGPVLADTLTISGGSNTLIPFHQMPPGTPLNSSTSYLPASKPTHWGG